MNCDVVCSTTKINNEQKNRKLTVNFGNSLKHPYSVLISNCFGFKVQIHKSHHNNKKFDVVF
jgi:hypothetical protein